MAVRKGSLAAIPELYGFTLEEKVEGYETVESDSDSDSTSSVDSAILPLGGDLGRKHKEKEDGDDESDDGSHFLGETMTERWHEMRALCAKMTDAEERHMVGFLLSVVSNVCRMEPTQVIQWCYGLKDDCAAVEMDKIEVEAREVCSLADNYKIMKSELFDKRQEVGNLEEDVKGLRKKVEWLEGQVRFQKRVRGEDRKNSDTKRQRFMEPEWQDVAC